MITKYRTGYAFDDQPIVKVECERETDHSVFINAGAYGQQHHSKNCNAFQYHDTWADARAYLIESGVRSVNQAKKLLNAAKAALELANKTPEVEP